MVNQSIVSHKRQLIPPSRHAGDNCGASSSRETHISAVFLSLDLVSIMNDIVLSVMQTAHKRWSTKTDEQGPGLARGEELMVETDRAIERLIRSVLESQHFYFEKQHTFCFAWHRRSQYVHQ